MWTIYTYWNSDSLIGALNAVVLVVGGANWLGLMQTVALLGLLTSTTAGLVKFSFKEPALFLGMLAIFYGVMFVPKVTVSVQDLRSGSVGTVANVPLGMAFFATTTSHIGKFLTETYESAFVATDELKFSRTGMAWAAGAMRSMTEVRLKNPKGNEAFSVFVRSCVIPEITDNTDKYTQLVTSTDMLALLKTSDWLNAGRIADMPNRSGSGYTVMPCAAGVVVGAIDDVEWWLRQELVLQRQQLGRILLPDASASTANTLIGSYLPGVEGYMLGASRSINDQLLQAMSVNLMADSAGNLAAVRGDPSSATLAIGTAIAQSQAVSSYRVLGMIGAEALPKMRNIVEILLISVFPIVLLVILLAGEDGIAVVKTYAMTSVWVQLWAPLYAVVNSMLLPMTAARIQAVAGGSTMTQNMENSARLMQVGFNEQAMAGALVLAVPVIAYALVKGGEVAMSGAIGSLSSPAQGAATSAGAQVGAGNISVGNTSWGNHSQNNSSANKWDSSPAWSGGRMTQTSGAYQTTADMNTGQAWTSGQAAVADLGSYSGLSGQKIGEAAQAARSTSWTQGMEAAQQYGAGMQSAYEQFSANSRSSAVGSGVETGASTGLKTSNGQSFEKAQSQAFEWANGLNLSNAQKFALTAQAGAGLSTPFAKALAQATGSSEAQAQELFNSAQKAGQSQAFKDVKQVVSEAGSTTSTSDTAKVSNDRQAGTRGTLQQSEQALETAKRSFQKADAISQGLSTNANFDAGMQKNLANRVQEILGGSQGLQAALKDADAGRPQKLEAAIQQAVGEAFESKFGGKGSPARNGAPALAMTPEAEGAQRSVEGETQRAGVQVAQRNPTVQRAGEADLQRNKAPATAPSLPAQGAGQPPITPATVRKAEAGASADTGSTAGSGQKVVATEVSGSQTTVNGRQEAALAGGGLVKTATANMAGGSGTAQAVATEALRLATGNAASAPATGSKPIGPQSLVTPPKPDSEVSGGNGSAVPAPILPKMPEGWKGNGDRVRGAS